MVIILRDGKQEEYNEAKLLQAIAQACNVGLPADKYEKYRDRLVRFVSRKKEMSTEAIVEKMIQLALEQVSTTEPYWNNVAKRLRLKALYREARRRRGTIYNEGKSLDHLIETLVQKGVYAPEMLSKFTIREMMELQKAINPERDQLFTYEGLTMLVDRYCAQDLDKGVYELPQERWMAMSMFIHQNETKHRIARIIEGYEELSKLNGTMATPTMSNASKAFGQLSSCFVDTLEDSLEGIYMNNFDVARLSKSGGGLGVYAGNIRSLGAPIRGFAGASGGVVPWIRQLNNTAVSVDQLGKRAGAVAVYLDIFHPDVQAFLDLRLSNGDEKERAHEIHLGLCIPDLFMRTLREDGEWHLFCPYDVEKHMGWKLQDSYDEKGREEGGSFTERYNACISNPLLPRKTVKAIDLYIQMFSSRLEGGEPYLFFRDEVNRKNPNKHAGMIYCSNLCTEIYQNMSPTVFLEEIITSADGKRRKQLTFEMGDFVVCNLASLNLSKFVGENRKNLAQSIKVFTRMLDNVIDLNKERIDVKQAVDTNDRYRAIGLGTYGLHHMMALEGVRWESQEALDFNDKLYEEINFHAITASMELAKERGAYPLFKGSEWDTGEYFERRGYILHDTVTFDTVHWEQLADDVHEYGMRNGNVMAVAPNTSTSVIAGTTASRDPIFDLAYSEERKGFKFTVVAPDLSPSTFGYYAKGAFKIDQSWSVASTIRAQRHVDQGISFNMYFEKGLQIQELYERDMQAWEGGLKGVYYTRTKNKQDAGEDCFACQ